MASPYRATPPWSSSRTVRRRKSTARSSCRSTSIRIGRFRPRSCRKDLIPKNAGSAGLSHQEPHPHFRQQAERAAAVTRSINTRKTATITRSSRIPAAPIKARSIRINFPSAFGVYMHDHAAEGIFSARISASIRQGYMRVQNVRQLVAWLLEGTINWSLDDIDRVIKSGDRKDAQLTKPNARCIGCSVTAWSGADGVVQFPREGIIYGKDGLGGDPSRDIEFVRSCSWDWAGSTVLQRDGSTPLGLARPGCNSSPAIPKCSGFPPKRSQELALQCLRRSARYAIGEGLAVRRTALGAKKRGRSSHVGPLWCSHGGRILLRYGRRKRSGDRRCYRPRIESRQRDEIELIASGRTSSAAPSWRPRVQC